MTKDELLQRMKVLALRMLSITVAALRTTRAKRIAQS